MPGSKKRLRLKWLAFVGSPMDLHGFRIRKEGEVAERSECGLDGQRGPRAEKAQKCAHCLFTNSRNRR